MDLRKRERSEVIEEEKKLFYHFSVSAGVFHLPVGLRVRRDDGGDDFGRFGGEPDEYFQSGGVAGDLADGGGTKWPSGAGVTEDEPE